MSYQVVIVGKNSLLGNNLFSFFKKKKIDAKLIKFSSFSKIKYAKVKYLINCSVHPNYLQKYRNKFDKDLKIANYIKNFSTRYIFLSSGKVYGNYNRPIDEDGKCLPRSMYAKNKLITEKKLKKILKKKLIIFRVSNIISYNLKRKRLKTFFNVMIKDLINKDTIFLPKKKYLKDFLSVKDFCNIIYKSIKLDLPSNIYNLSSGIGLDIRNIAYTVIKGYKSGKISFTRKNTDNYILDSTRLFNKIKIKININSLFNEIYDLGKFAKSSKNKKI